MTHEYKPNEVKFLIDSSYKPMVEQQRKARHYLAKVINEEGLPDNVRKDAIQKLLFGAIYNLQEILDSSDIEELLNAPKKTEKQIQKAIDALKEVYL